MDKLLTIVIPSYNVEQTLRQTVESMLVSDQNLRMLLDILIVNDGSKDGTLALARQLEAENPDIVRVWNKENGGHGSTINVGIDHGYGKYMKIVDGDDWLETGTLEQYLKVLSTTEADIVATDYYHYFMSDGIKKAVKSSQLPYGENLKFKYIWNNYTFFMLSLAVKTDLLRNQRYRIDEHCYYVDIEFDTLVAMVIKTVQYLDMKLYVYRLQNTGQSVSVQGRIKHYLEHERIVFTLIEIYNNLIASHPESVDKISYVEKRIIRSMRGHYCFGLDFPKEEKRIFTKHLKAYDARLKSEGKRVYHLASKNIVGKLCRITGFSITAYSFLGWIKSIKNIVRKR